MGNAICATGALSRWIGWLAYAVALLSVGSAPAIFGGKDFLEALVAGGAAFWDGRTGHVVEEGAIGAGISLALLVTALAFPDAFG